MIRNTVFGISLLALTSASAFAAPAKHHQAKARVMAEATAPAGDPAPTTGEKGQKKAKKSSKKDQGGKAAGSKEIKASPATTVVPAPAPATK